MTGHNHYSWCMCGWCVGGGGTSAPPPPISPRILAAAMTTPNARCPVCGASVFFYQNSVGSRVFFDSLGPPWPKHPCTDHDTSQARVPVRTPERNATSPSLAPTLQPTTNWIPLRFLRLKSEDQWTVGYFENVLTDEFIRILLDFRPDLSDRLPAYMTAWDPHGRCELQFLDGSFDIQHGIGWRYAEWFSKSPSVVHQEWRDRAIANDSTRKSRRKKASPGAKASHLPKGHFAERDRAIVAAGFPKLPGNIKKRAIELKRLVAEGVLLPNGLPNPTYSKRQRDK